MTPRVTAMLAWWEEPAELLDQAVRSLEGFCDRLVAFDGGYELCPGATPTSPPDQLAAVRAAANAVGVDLEVCIPTRLWAGQVQKRDAMLQAAADPAKADWVMPLDADWVVGGQKPVALHQIMFTHAEAMQVVFHTPRHPDLDPHVTGSNAWHIHTLGDQCIELVFRVMPPMAVEMRHWWYAGTRPDGTRVGLWGDPPGTTPGTKERLSGLRIDHLCHHRNLDLVVRNREFCDARDRQVALTGVEA